MVDDHSLHLGFVGGGGDRDCGAVTVGVGRRSKTNFAMA